MRGAALDAVLLQLPKSHDDQVITWFFAFFINIVT